MLESARKLAQVYLWKELNGTQPVSENLDGWFAAERAQNPQRFFPFLIENPGKIETVFVISPSPTDENLAVLESVSIDQFGTQPSEKLPFNMPSGSQSAALGPIFKRSYSNDKGAGPSDKIVNTTLNSFVEKGQSDLPWSGYFREISLILGRKKLQIQDEVFESDEKYGILHLAIKKISATKTVFLTVKDLQGRYPGDVPEYVKYLQTILPESKYTSLKTPKQSDQTCPLCFSQNVTVYPSACSGAGINVSNVDRDGAFPGLDPALAFQGYALCLDCADLLYIFKFYVLNALHIYVAGAKAVLIPNLSAIVSEDLDLLLDSIQKYSRGDETAVSQESKILDYLQADKAIATFDIIWADFGQKMENIRGMITDVFPSRLRALKKQNEGFTQSKDQSPYSPRHWHDDADFTLDLKIVHALFKRPGGKSAEKANDAASFKEFKNEIVACIYKKKHISADRIWAEAQIVMEWHIKDAIKSDEPGYSLTREGYSEKKNIVWFTLAGWVRHFAVFLDYLYEVEVLERMENKRTYTPEWKKLKPYFGPDSAINNNEKAFAFVLGTLFGRLLSVQGARGVNVSANALTYLKNLNLSGKDLPLLHNQTRQKMMDYQAEKRESVRNLLKELGWFGSVLGTDIKLDKTETCYFLLMGQAISSDVFAKDETIKEEN